MSIFQSLADLVMRRKAEEPQQLEITPEIAGRLNELGLHDGDFCYQAAARFLLEYPDSFETLRRLPADVLRDNQGFPYSAIRTYGTVAVNGIIDRYGIESAGYLNEVCSALEESDQDTIDEVVKEFGVGRVGTIAPIYRAWMEAKEKSIAEETKQYKITFKGTVQDVGFRGTARYRAEIFGISCSAKNQDDGSVLCRLSGTEPIVDVFILSLRKTFKVSEVIKEQY